MLREGRTLKKLSLLAILMLLLFSMSACNKNGVVNAGHETNSDNICLNIVTTNKILFYAVKDIVGDKHYVRYMFNTEDEQLNFTYTQDSLNNIAKQDLLIYMGADAEPWISSFTDELSKSKVCFVNASTGISLIKLANPIKIKDYQIKNNSYYYLNADNYKIMLLNVKIAIEEKDPKNRAVYENNFTKCVKEIDNLQKQVKDIKTKSKDCVFLVDDDKLDYFIDYCSLKSYVLPMKSLNDTGEYDKQIQQLQTKISGAKKVYYLYDNETNYAASKDFLQKNKVIPVAVDFKSNDYNAAKILEKIVNGLESAMK